MYIHLYIYVYIYIYKDSCECSPYQTLYCHHLCQHTHSTGLQRGIGFLIYIVLFAQKSPVVIGSFAERDLQVTAFYASLPHFMKIHLDASLYIQALYIHPCVHLSF